jgi:hypothetical protein
VTELDALCAVYATDAFTRVGGTVQPHVRVGVHMHNDLLQLDVDIPELESGEVAEILQSYREAKRYHRLRSGRFVSLDDEALCGLAALAEDIGCDDTAWRDGRLTVPLYRALYIAEKSGMEAIGVDADLRAYRLQMYRNLREVLARCKDFYMTQRQIAPSHTEYGE